jgi:hypothetical protein
MQITDFLHKSKRNNSGANIKSSPQKEQENCVVRSFDYLYMHPPLPAFHRTRLCHAGNTAQPSV